MSRKLKVCHICSYYENILFDNLVKEQILFTEPRVFFFKKYGSGNQYNDKRIDEVECYNNIDRIFFFLKAKKVFTKYKELYKNEEFDLLFAHSLFANGYIAYLANKQFGTPDIVMVQNTYINVFYRFKPYLSRIALKVMSNAKKIIFASTCYKDYLLINHIPSRLKKKVDEKTKVVPYGIEDIFYNSDITFKQKTDNEFKIICVGLICRNKNQIGLAKAIKKLNDDGYQIKLTVIGKIDNEKLVEKLRSYNFVEILPYMSKKALVKEYKNADIFALVSLTETFGLVYAEALSQGLPIVYSKGQGFDGQFVEGFVGYSALADSTVSISNAIRKTIQEYDLLKKHTVKASYKFKWDNVTEQYKQLYTDIIYGVPK